MIKNLNTLPIVPTKWCWGKTMLLKYERCGKYELLEKLAGGGMADVFLARSVSTDGACKFFAIKRIKPEFSNYQNFVTLFKEEAKIAISLNHNNIVSVLDFGCESGQYYLVMDYIQGYTLKEIIDAFKKSKKTFSIDQVLYLIKEAATGLNHAHHSLDASSGRPLNLIHRDVSPQNIMLSYQGTVKVIDFGIAKVDRANPKKNESRNFDGKMRYMSPEQASRENLDLRSDIFSLGLVLWELLTNERLFDDKNQGHLLQKIKLCLVPSITEINPAIPKELEQIVFKTLAKDPKDRYQTAAELGRDLNRLLNLKYPQFSPQSFSVFIKMSFNHEYKASREKLAHYAQIPWVERAELINLNQLDAASGTDEPIYKTVILSTGDNSLDLPHGLDNFVNLGSSTSTNLNFENVSIKSSVSSSAVVSPEITPHMSSTPAILPDRRSPETLFKFAIFVVGLGLLNYLFYKFIFLFFLTTSWRHILFTFKNLFG